jgi:hypothetical protein
MSFYHVSAKVEVIIAIATSIAPSKTRESITSCQSFHMVGIALQTINVNALIVHYNVVTKMY